MILPVCVNKSNRKQTKKSLKEVFMEYKTLEQLLNESSRQTESQPVEFRETLQYVLKTEMDSSIRELIDIVSSFSEPSYSTTTLI
jgi:ElaB/YqjD/DUF883 family membrane-anchored ribosome-binding protein